MTRSGLSISMFALMAALVSTARAETVLIEDLAAALEPVMKAKPRDPAAFLVLGRAEALGFINRLEKVEIEGRLEPGKVPALADDAGQPQVGLPASAAQAAKFLSGALERLATAIELNRNDPRGRLAMAQLLEHGAPSAAEMDVLPRLTAAPPVMNAGQIARTEKLIEELGDEAKRDAAAKELRKHLDETAPIVHAHRAAGIEAARKIKADLLTEQWREQAIAGYLQVYQIAAKAELAAIQAKRLRAAASLTCRSLDGFIRLTEQRGPRGPEAQQLPKMKAVHAALLQMSP